MMLPERIQEIDGDESD